MKPLLASNADNMQEVLKSFNGDEQALARTVLNIIVRLPKVSLVKNQLFIDGQIYDTDVTKMVKEIIKNKITGAESVLHLLRGANGNTSMMSYDDSFDETLIPYLARESQAEPFDEDEVRGTVRKRGRKNKSGPLRTSTPARPPAPPQPRSPLKTRGQRLREAVKKTKTVSPRDVLQKIAATGRKNAGNKPQRWLTYN